MSYRHFRWTGEPPPDWLKPKLRERDGVTEFNAYRDQWVPVSEGMVFVTDGRTVDAVRV